MRSYMEEYQYWLNSNCVDAETRAELQKIADDEEEIRGRFSGMMTFGTSGLRGTMKAGTRNMNVYTVRYAAQALANLINREGGGLDGHNRNGAGVVVAHDSRNNSAKFAREVACVMAANNIKCYLFEDMRPTPELSYSIRELGAIAGVNITASHNVKEYNGFKAYWADGAQLNAEKAGAVSDQFGTIDIFKDIKTINLFFGLSRGLVQLIGESVDEKYLAEVLAQSVGQGYVEEATRDVTVVYTPFHGVGFQVVPDMLSRIGVTNIVPVREQMIPDGEFPTLKSPNPEIPDGFALGVKYALENDADIVIGTDPDSDRCACVVKVGDRHRESALNAIEKNPQSWSSEAEGRYIALTGNQMACLMMDFLFSQRRAHNSLPDNAAATKSIVSTLMVDKICEAYGVNLFEVLTGFKYVGEKIGQIEAEGRYKFVFGFEESIGFLAGDYCRDKDAVVAAMILAEMTCYYRTRGMTVYDGLHELYGKYGYYAEDTRSVVFQGYDAQVRMTEVMSELRQNPPSEIGLKVLGITDYQEGQPGFEPSNVLVYELADGCRIAVRPSGTEPKVKTYVLAQGASEEEAQAHCRIIRVAADRMLSQS